jgi:hypothetical protein
LVHAESALIGEQGMKIIGDAGRIQVTGIQNLDIAVRIYQV